jgi:hypothetical protein
MFLIDLFIYKVISFFTKTEQNYKNTESYIFLENGEHNNLNDTSFSDEDYTDECW